jgi:hypothetical protein
MLAIGLSYLAFTMLRNFPSIPSFLRAFIIKRCWILSKVFFFFYWGEQVVFVFASINVLYYIYRFAYVEPSLHSWDEAELVMLYWSWWIIFLICCWIRFVIILLSIFASMFIKDIGL